MIRKRYSGWVRWPADRSNEHMDGRRKEWTETKASYSQIGTGIGAKIGNMSSMRSILEHKGSTVTRKLNVKLILQLVNTVSQQIQSVMKLEILESLYI